MARIAKKTEIIKTRIKNLPFKDVEERSTLKFNPITIANTATAVDKIINSATNKTGKPTIVEYGSVLAFGIFPFSLILSLSTHKSRNK